MQSDYKQLLTICYKTLLENHRRTTLKHHCASAILSYSVIRDG